MADRGLQGRVRRQGRHAEHRGDHRRPPEQAGDRQLQGAGAVRPAGRRHDPRRADVVGRARGRHGGQPEEEALPEHRRRHHRADRQVVQQVHVPLRVRHVHAGQEHRHHGHQPGRRRTGTSSTRTTRSARTCRSRSPRPSRAPAARSSRSDPTPFPNDNFSTFLLKAPNLNPKPDVLGTMQAGGDLVNLVKQYNEFGLKAQGHQALRRPDVHHRHPRPRPGRLRRHHVHRRLVLEPRRPQPRLGRPVPAAHEDPAVVRPRRQLLGRDCSTCRPCSGPAPTTPTRSSRSSRTTRSTTCSPATPRSAPRTTASSTTSYLAEVKPKSEVTQDWDYEKILRTDPGRRGVPPGRQSAAAGCKMG